VKPVLWVTGIVAAAALAVLLMADGVVEVAGYELLVMGAGGAAVFALVQLKPKESADRTPLIAGIGTAKSRNQPPQLMRLEWLVEFASSTSFDTEYRLLPELRAIAARRMQQRHGVDLESQPEEARDLVGEAAWSYLDPHRHPLRTGEGIELAELDAVVTAVERL